jgi:exodeoxyribonuclease VII large subunit
MSQKTYSLSELNSHIERILKVNFEQTLWIRAEVSELRESGGHCYLELIEKDEQTESLTARMRATIWSSAFRLLKPYFEESTGQCLRSGLSILVAVTVDFHAVYGMSLNIKDIDPKFTLGAQAQRRMEIIHKLEKEGVMDMNKSLPLATLPQRIAVISSSSAAGYEDFMNHIQHHPSKYVFYIRLFPAIMQGDQASSSIIGCLEAIFEHIDRFDVVVVIRGGGATTDLACFDDYELALNCAQFPLPILSGIGHQRDLSIVDMVAHSSVKTPTAAAALLIEHLVNAESKLLALYNGIYTIASNTVRNEQQRIVNLRWKIKNALIGKSRDKLLELQKNKMRLTNSIQSLISHHQNKLNLYQSNLERHSPANMLKYGYTITTQNGNRITSIHELLQDLPITTILPDGKIDSIIIPPGNTGV